MTANDTNWEEKRSHPRIPRRFIMRARAQTDETKRWDMPILENISLAGCYFISSVRYEPDQMVDIEVQLPVSPEPMRCVGKVLRIEPKGEVPDSPCGIAVQFLEVEEDKKQKFQEVVDFTLKRLKEQASHK